MIFMALLPKNDRPVSHMGGYPATKDLWKTVCMALNSRVGSLLADDRYRLVLLDDKALTIERAETKSVVRVTRKKVEKTYEKLLAGAVIPFRQIDYTVAIEFGVVLALGTLVEADEAAKVYRLTPRKWES